MTRFNLGNIVSLFIEKECADINRYLSLHSGCPIFESFFLKDTENLNGTGFCVADNTDAVASRAGNVAAFIQCGTQSLTGNFH